MKHKYHQYNDDGICIHCSHDGASTDWELRNLAWEIGAKEYLDRSQKGEFNFHRYCKGNQHVQNHSR